MKHVLSVLLLLFIVPQVIAGPFDPPPTDQSVKMLGIIFGSNIGDLPLGGSPNPVLSDLMEKFNFIIVVVGMIVVSYVSILSIINTAHEGTAMGKKWSAVWIPMRSVAGMALMVPAPASGYSMIQVTVMWIILQGIGAADQLWDIALDGLASGASVSAGTIVDPKLKNQGMELAKSLLNAKTCMSTLYDASLSAENQNAGNNFSKNGSLISDYAVSPGSPTYTVGTSGQDADASCPGVGAQYAEMKGYINFGIENGTTDEQTICGQVTIKASVCSDEFKKVTDQTVDKAQMLDALEEIYYTKQNTVSTMLTALQGLSDGFVSEDYVQPVPSTETSTKEPPPGFMEFASTQYQNQMSGLIISPPAGAGFANNISQEMKKQIADGKQNGWISAGSFYFIFNKTLEGKLFKTATADADLIKDNGTIPTCTQDICTKGFPDENSIPAIVNIVPLKPDRDRLAKNLVMSDAYAKANAVAVGSIFNAPGETSNSGPAQAISAVSSMNADAISNMSNMLKSNDPALDPLLGLARFGQSLMLGVEATVIAMISMMLIMGPLTMLQNDLIFFGTTIPAWPRLGSFASYMMMIMLIILGILLPLFAAMWSFGAMLAVYCPLIPFMIFAMTALGWLLTVVEAIVAAPIVALGFILPGGDELGKIEAALTILANVFLRPMLMLFGFILAGRLFKGVVMLINFGMGSVFSAVSFDSIFSSLAVIGVYTMFIVGMTNTCFSLIYAIPDKILRWIGGAGEHTDTSGLKDAKEGAEKVGGAVGGLLQDAGKKAGGKGSKMAGEAFSKYVSDQKTKAAEKAAAKTAEETESKTAAGPAPAAGGGEQPAGGGNTNTTRGSEPGNDRGDV